MRHIFRLSIAQLIFRPDIDTMSAVAIPALFVLVLVERRVVGAACELLPAGGANASFGWKCAVETFFGVGSQRNACRKSCAIFGAVSADTIWPNKTFFVNSDSTKPSSMSNPGVSPSFRTN